MSIFLRFILTLSGLFLIGLFAGDWFHRANIRAIEDMLEERRTDHSHFLDSSIKLQGTELKAWVASFSWWDEAVKFMSDHDAEWASENIDMMVGTTGGGDSVWVTTPELEVIHRADDEFRFRPPPFDDLGPLRQLIADNYEFSYFINIDGELWEIFGAAIQDPNFWRNETPIVGYCFIGRHWDQDFLARLGTLTHTHLEVLSVGRDANEIPANDLVFSELTFNHPILGTNDEIIATMRGTFSAPAIEKLHDTLHQNQQWRRIIFSLLLIVAGCILGLTIVQPIGRIIRSLDTRDPVHLSDLLVAKSDFGEIARLISSQFRRGRMLQEEIRRRGNIPANTNDHRTMEALRLRLASNLHDGPMQLLYAARLKLGAMQSAIKNNTPPATEDIAGIANILEECSKDLRNLLLDIEPEELRNQGLASTLPRFEKHLRSLATEAATFKVSPDAFAECSQATQIQLLYLIRELVSNIGRHSKPQFITFVIERTDDSLILTCENDGLNQRATPEPGNGLENVDQRVQDLGGNWKQEVTRKKTWLVRITLPIPTKLDQPLAIEDA